MWKITRARVGVIIVVGLAVLMLAMLKLRARIDSTSERQLLNTRATLAMVGHALETFHREGGRYPTNDEGLECLGRSIGGRGPLIRTSDSVRDGWNQLLIYREPGNNSSTHFVLYSIGPNERDEAGQGDDIDFTSEEVQRLLPN